VDRAHRCAPPFPDLVSANVVVIFVVLVVRRAHALENKVDDLEKDIGHDSGIGATCHNANCLNGKENGVNPGPPRRTPS
jgi:hypothetical protein